MAERILFMDKATILDIVKENLHLPDNEICKLIFHAMCQEHSVELIYNDRLENHLQNCISDVKLKFGLSPPKNWKFKVLESEFVRQEQFQQICRENLDVGSESNKKEERDSDVHMCVEGM